MWATDWIQVVTLIASALAASAVAAVAGFGGAVLLLPVLVWVFGVRDAVPILTIAQCVENGSRVWFNRTDIEHRVRHRSGRYVSMEARATNKLDDPAVSGWVVTARDVSDRVRARQALAESEARFRFLAENSSDIIARHAADGTFRYVSAASEALTGFPPHDLVGRRMQELVHPDDVERIDQSL